MGEVARLRLWDYVTRREPTFWYLADRLKVESQGLAPQAGTKAACPNHIGNFAKLILWHPSCPSRGRMQHR